MEIKGEIYSYNSYMQFLTKLVNEESTTGELQTEELVAFTNLNLKRMERLNKTLIIQDSLVQCFENEFEKQTWVVLVEAWCGDCAQNLPVIGKIAESSKGLIDLKIIIRDQNMHWFDKYLTNGSKSIPKLIAFNKEHKELFTWGPRPLPAQKLLLNYKLNPNGKSWNDFETELHTWYAKDKSQTIQIELTEKFK